MIDEKKISYERRENSIKCVFRHCVCNKNSLEKTRTKQNKSKSGKLNEPTIYVIIFFRNKKKNTENNIIRRRFWCVYVVVATYESTKNWPSAMNIEFERKKRKSFYWFDCVLAVV